jgi:hypothetical protein
MFRGMSKAGSAASFGVALVVIVYEVVNMALMQQIKALAKEKHREYLQSMEQHSDLCRQIINNVKVVFYVEMTTESRVKCLRRVDKILAKVGRAVAEARRVLDLWQDVSLKVDIMGVEARMALKYSEEAKKKAVFMELFEALTDMHQAWEGMDGEALKIRNVLDMEQIE